MENDDKSKKSFFSRNKYWIIPLAIVLGIVVFLVTGSILWYSISLLILYISYRYFEPESKREKGFVSYIKEKYYTGLEILKSRFRGKEKEGDQ